MSSSLTDYIKALTVCVCAAVGYRFVVVPLIEPPAGKLVEMHSGMQELTAPDLGHVFAADSWQMNEPKVLQAEWGWLLFQRWEQDAPDRWRVSPVSIVMKDRGERESSEPQGPILLEAAEGAVIEFAEPLNMISGTTPAIKGGQLLGEVHIYNHTAATSETSTGGSAGDGAGDGHASASDSHYQVANPQTDSNRATSGFDARTFDLKTYNVRIDSKQIRSAEQVQLQVGGSRIFGRDLTIKLAAGGTLPISNDSPLSVLDSLELIYLDELLVPLPDGPLWQPTSTKGKQPVDVPYRDARLNVVCDGRVVFDFATFTLKMNERVELRHHWSERGYDSFACRVLEIQLANPFLKRNETADPATGDSPSNPLDRISSNLKKIVARGAPIQADVPSVDSRLTAREINFNTREGELKVLGGGETIDIAYGTVQLSIADLTYKLNPTDPSKLGTLVIEGPGKAMLADKAMVLRTFAWNQTMQVLPQEVGHLLWIAGAVNAKMRDGGSVVADDLLVAFELTSNPNKTPSANAAKSLNASSDADSQVSLRLDKLRARGSVKVDTSQLAAETDTLLVLFDHIQSLPNRDDEQTESIGPMLNPASGARQKFWITEPQTPSGNSQASSVATTIAPVAGPRPVLAGNAITANLVLSGNRVVAQDLSVLKNVRLKHELQTKTAPLPLVYTGDSLRLITGMGDDRVQIAGTPARIDLGDGFFEGPLVVISGRENRVSIRDRGTFQLPITILPSGQGDAIRWLKPPRCEFTGELTFNGQLVEITDSVMIAGQLSVGQKAEAWDVNATAPRLQLTLDRSINVTNPTDAKTAAVDRISLVGESNDVLLVATQLDPTGQPIGRHVLSNPRLDFYATTGQLIGPGPGWYRSWTPSTEESPLRSVAPPGSLLAAHLLYNGGLDGNLADRQLGFHQGVRIGISAVDRWDRVIDAATMTQLAINQGTVDCDRLQIGVAPTSASSPPSDMPWEIQALGGVAFRMRSERGLVDGTAARAAYDAGNDLFVLEGTMQRGAVVRNTSPTGQQLFNVEMPSFTLRPGTMEVNALMRQATVSQIPGQRP